LEAAVFAIFRKAHGLPSVGLGVFAIAAVALPFFLLTCIICVFGRKILILPAIWLALFESHRE
jgi:hypothetical protein